MIEAVRQGLARDFTKNCEFLDAVWNAGVSSSSRFKNGGHIGLLQQKRNALCSTYVFLIFCASRPKPSEKRPYQ